MSLTAPVRDDKTLRPLEVRAYLEDFLPAPEAVSSGATPDWVDYDAGVTVDEVHAMERARYVSAVKSMNFGIAGGMSSLKGYSVQGTVTSRISSQDPNLQAQPTPSLAPGGLEQVTRDLIQARARLYNISMDDMLPTDGACYLTGPATPDDPDKDPGA